MFSASRRVETIILAGVDTSEPTWSLVSSVVCYWGPEAGVSICLSVLMRQCKALNETHFVSLDVSSPSNAILRGRSYHSLAVDFQLGEI